MHLVEPLVHFVAPLLAGVEPLVQLRHTALLDLAGAVLGIQPLADLRQTVRTLLLRRLLCGQALLQKLHSLVTLCRALLAQRLALGLLRRRIVVSAAAC